MKKSLIVFGLVLIFWGLIIGSVSVDAEPPEEGKFRVVNIVTHFECCGDVDGTWFVECDNPSCGDSTSQGLDRCSNTCSATKNGVTVTWKNDAGSHQHVTVSCDAGSWNYRLYHYVHRVGCISGASTGTCKQEQDEKCGSSVPNRPSACDGWYGPNLCGYVKGAGLVEGGSCDPTAEKERLNLINFSWLGVIKYSEIDEKYFCVERCGNEVLDAGEECDWGTDINGDVDLGVKSCNDFEGYLGGKMRCTSDCKYDLSECLCEEVDEICDDGIDNDLDGKIDLEDEDCKDDCSVCEGGYSYEGECIKDKDGDGFIPQGSYSNTETENCLGDCNDNLETGGICQEFFLEPGVCDRTPFSECSFCIHPRENVAARRCGVDFSCETFGKSADEVPIGFQEVNGNFVWNGLDNSVQRCGEAQQCVISLVGLTTEDTKVNEEVDGETFTSDHCNFWPSGISRLGQTDCGFKRIIQNQVNGRIYEDEEYFTRCFPESEDLEINTQYGEFGKSGFEAFLNSDPRCKNIALVPSNKVEWRSVCVEKDKCIDKVDNDGKEDIYGIDYLQNYIEKKKTTILPSCCGKIDTKTETRRFNSEDEDWFFVLKEFKAKLEKDNPGQLVECHVAEISYKPYAIECFVREEVGVNWVMAIEDCSNSGGEILDDLKCEGISGKPKPFVSESLPYEFSLVDVDDPDCHKNPLYCEDKDGDKFCAGNRGWCLSHYYEEPLKSNLECNELTLCMENFEKCLSIIEPDKKYQDPLFFPDCVDDENNFDYKNSIARGGKYLIFDFMNEETNQLEGKKIEINPGFIHPLAPLGSEGVVYLEGLAAACMHEMDLNCNKGWGDVTQGVLLNQFHLGRTPFDDDLFTGVERVTCSDSNEDVDYYCRCSSLSEATNKELINAGKILVEEGAKMIILAPLFMAASVVPGAAPVLIFVGVPFLMADVGKTVVTGFKFYKALYDGRPAFVYMEDLQRGGARLATISMMTGISLPKNIRSMSVTQAAKKGLGHLVKTTRKVRDYCTTCAVDKPIVPGCFLSGTQILMSSGEYKNIEDIQLEEGVVAYDTEKKQAVNSTVSYTFIRNETKYRKITYEVIENE